MISLDSFSRITVGASLFLLASISTGCRASAGIEELVGDIQVDKAHGVDGAWVKSSTLACLDAPEQRAGHVVFRLPTKRVYRMEAHAGAVATDVSHELDRLSQGVDAFINLSPDGDWLLVQTSRFGCGEEMCLAVVSSNLCQAQVVVEGGRGIAGASMSAIGPRGEVVVFPSNEGRHAMDLYAVHRTPEGWSPRVLLTTDSSSNYNQQPAISNDGKRVLFDCGSDPGSGAGTSICEVGTDGTGFRKVLTSQWKGGQRAALHHADYAPDGTVVLEGTWNKGAEQVWQAAKDEAPALINAEVDEKDANAWRFSDDNSPCVLPDGRIVSLWLGRRGAGQRKPSGHELKVMNADGTNPQMLLTDVDVVDIGIGCGM